MRRVLFSHLKKFVVHFAHGLRLVFFRSLVVLDLRGSFAPLRAPIGAPMGTRVSTWLRLQLALDQGVQEQIAVQEQDRTLERMAFGVQAQRPQHPASTLKIAPNSWKARPGAMTATAMAARALVGGRVYIDESYKPGFVQQGLLCCLFQEGVSKSVQALLNGIEAVVELTLDDSEIARPVQCQF